MPIANTMMIAMSEKCTGVACSITFLDDEAPKDVIVIADKDTNTRLFTDDANNEDQANNKWVQDEFGTDGATDWLGCGCNSTTSTSGAITWFALLGLALVGRRRKTHSP